MIIYQQYDCDRFYTQKAGFVRTMKSNSAAYLVWLLWFFGVGGLHRIYCGRVFSGFIYLFTWGLFGFGQLLDIILIPSLVDEANLKNRALYGVNINNTQTQNQQVVVNLGDYLPPTYKQIPEKSVKSDIQIILQLAKDNNGASFSDCVLATNKPAKDVKKLLGEMCQDLLLEPTNHPTNGAVIYKMI